MIRVVYEDPVIGFAIHNLPSSTFHPVLVAKKYCIKIFCGDLLTSVILLRLTHKVSSVQLYKFIATALHHLKNKAVLGLLEIITPILLCAGDKVTYLYYKSINHG